MTAHIYILGLDELNLQTLEHLPGDYAFHPLLEKEDVVGVEHIDMSELLVRARRQLRDSDGPIDAIMGYWDFPVSSMVPILCAEFGLPGPPLEAIVTCEHKYWSRLEQREVIDDVPAFGIIDLDGPAELPTGVSFPVWVKPVKSASSELAFHVENDDDLTHALEEIRGGIDKFGEPFEFIIDRIDLPPQITAVGATACLAEEAMSGRQLTVEGFCSHGRTHVYGIIDSLSYPDSSSFLRYQYPSQLPQSVQQRLIDSTTKVIDRIGLDTTAFNVEYFWEAEADRIALLEVNPRYSQSHAIMFERVDGVANHEVAVQVALGHGVHWQSGAGPDGVAAKWFLRSFVDGRVTSGPSAADVAAIEQETPGVTVDVVAEPGSLLSELVQQDSYSFELAQIFIGARDETELIEKYERCVRELGFEIDGRKVHV